MIDVMPIARLGDAEGGAFQILRPTTGVAYYPFFYNTTRFPMDDMLVRQALNYAIDREAIQAVLFGQAEIRSNPIPPNHWAFNPDAMDYRVRDLDKAKELLAEAGWADSNGDGIFDKDGQDLEFTLDALNLRYEFIAMAEVMEASWTELGVKVTINTMEIGALIEKVCNQQDSQMFASGEIPWSDPGDLLTRMYNGCASMVQWQNDRFDEVMALGAQEPNREKRIPYYYEAQEIFQRELPSSVVAERPQIHAAANSVMGFHVHPRQIMNFETVYLEE
jgi:ABC-type transport system substrate-binding protein